MIARLIFFLCIYWKNYDQVMPIVLKDIWFQFKCACVCASWCLTAKRLFWTQFLIGDMCSSGSIRFVVIYYNSEWGNRTTVTAAKKKENSIRKVMRNWNRWTEQKRTEQLRRRKNWGKNELSMGRSQRVSMEIYQYTYICRFKFLEIRNKKPHHTNNRYFNERPVFSWVLFPLFFDFVIPFRRLQ